MRMYRLIPLAVAASAQEAIIIPGGALNVPAFTNVADKNIFVAPIMDAKLVEAVVNSTEPACEAELPVVAANGTLSTNITDSPTQHIRGEATKKGCGHKKSCCHHGHGKKATATKSNTKAIMWTAGSLLVLLTLVSLYPYLRDMIPTDRISLEGMNLEGWNWANLKESLGNMDPKEYLASINPREYLANSYLGQQWANMNLAEQWANLNLAEQWANLHVGDRIWQLWNREI